MNIEYFNRLGSTIRNDARCKVQAKLSLRRKILKCYIWSIALYGAENWTLWKVDQKYLESFGMWC